MAMKNIMTEWKKFLKEENSNQDLKTKIEKIEQRNELLIDQINSSKLFNQENLNDVDSEILEGLNDIAGIRLDELVKDVDPNASIEEIKFAKDQFIGKMEEIQALFDQKNCSSQNGFLDINESVLCKKENQKSQIWNNIKEIFNNSVTIIKGTHEFIMNDKVNPEKTQTNTSTQQKDPAIETCTLSMDLGFTPKAEFSKCVNWMRNPKNLDQCPDYLIKNKQGQCVPYATKQELEKWARQGINFGNNFQKHILRTCNYAVKLGLVPENEISKCSTFMYQNPNKCPSKMKTNKEGACVSINDPYCPQGQEQDKKGRCMPIAYVRNQILRGK